MCDSIWFDFPYDWMRVTYQFMRVKLKLFWVVFINGLIIFFRRSLFTRTLTWICIYIYAFPFPLSFCWDWQILHKPHIIIPMILLEILANISDTNLFTWLRSFYQVPHMEPDSLVAVTGQLGGPCLVGPTATTMFSS